MNCTLASAGGGGCYSCTSTGSAWAEDCAALLGRHKKAMQSAHAPTGPGFAVSNGVTIAGSNPKTERPSGCDAHGRSFEPEITKQRLPKRPGFPKIGSVGSSTLAQAAPQPAHRVFNWAP
jgi:hypothetical protein